MGVEIRVLDRDRGLLYICRNIVERDDGTLRTLMNIVEEDLTAAVEDLRRLSDLTCLEDAEIRNLELRYPESDETSTDEAERNEHHHRSMDVFIVASMMNTSACIMTCCVESFFHISKLYHIW